MSSSSFSRLTRVSSHFYLFFLIWFFGKRHLIKLPGLVINYSTPRRIEEYVDVTEYYAENIDVDEMLSTAAPTAALVTLISEKAPVALEPAASQDELKELASDVIFLSCRRLAAKPNINKYTFLIGICARYHISTSVDEADMKELQEYKGAAADDEYDQSLMRLPIIIDDGYDFYELSQENCAICWDKYLPGSQVILIQCLDELDHLIHNKYHQ
ncbi:hypothetical protein WN943_023880 [Citrus x changshan-huyou]